MKQILKIISYIPLSFIYLYKYTISPLIHSTCRYYPSCSEYGVEAILKYGPFKGAWLTLKRLLRCNPWGGHGYDPVP